MGRADWQGCQLARLPAEESAHGALLRHAARVRPAVFVVLLLALLGCEDYLTDRAIHLAKEKLAAPAPDAAVAAKPPSQAGLPKDPTLPLNLARPDEARVRVELYETREVVRMHRMEHGAPPPSLDALGLHLKFRSDLTYDPKTGVVKSRSYPQY